MVKIGLKDIELYAYHGVYDFERDQGGKYLVNIETTIDEIENPSDLNASINYEWLLEIVVAEMSKPTPLLEEVAYRIKDKLLLDARIKKYFIEIKKLQPPFPDQIVKASYVCLHS